MAMTRFRARVRWEKTGMLCTGKSRKFQLQLDEPEELGGTDKAMNPVELLLNALGGCYSIMTAAFAEHFGVDLHDVWVELAGDLDPDSFLGKTTEVRPGFTQIRAKVHIDSPSDQEKVHQLAEYVRTHCPVSDTLKGVPIETNFEKKS